MLGNNIFGIHEQALTVHVQRAHILAHNLANTSTPDYQPKDINFKLALAQAQDGLLAPSLMTTHPQHVGGIGCNDSMHALLETRVSSQPHVGGNTVDSHVEHAAYAENTLRYLANITFMNHRLQALNTVLSGGR